MRIECKVNRQDGWTSAAQDPQIYLCILLDNGKVVTVRDIVETSPKAAEAAAVRLLNQNDNCTTAEIWAKGRKIGVCQKLIEGGQPKQPAN